MVLTISSNDGLCVGLWRQQACIRAEKLAGQLPAGGGVGRQLPSTIAFRQSIAWKYPLR
jgi:hypothetical protein